MPSISQHDEENPSANDTGETSPTAEVVEVVGIDSASEDEGEPSLMAISGAKRLAKLKRKQNEEFKNKLQHLKHNPQHWEDPDNRYLREFSNYMECNR